jgi:hypothetical protein
MVRPRDWHVSLGPTRKIPLRGHTQSAQKAQCMRMPQAGGLLMQFNALDQSGRSVPNSPSGTKRAVGMMVSGGKVSSGLRENIRRCSLALEMKNG